MKKTFKVLAVVAMALGMFFTSCSQQVSNIEVVTVDASEITVKSYPGFNEISWTLVSNAKYYLYRNGVKVSSVGENDTNYRDDGIVDGVEYTYTVYTLPDNLVVKSEFNEEDLTAIGGNKVAYYTKGNKSSVTVTAIVPPFAKDGALVTALDLIDYDPNANAEAKVTAENIHFIYDDVDNTFKIEFPTVEYLNYKYQLYRGNAIEVFGKYAPSEENNVYSQDFGKGRASVSFINKAAGDYTLEVIVEDTNTAYKSSKVIAANKVTVETIDVSEETGTPVVAYIDNGENARVMWTPAVKTDEKTLWPEANYIVYVKDAKGVYTAINEVKAASTDDEGNEIAAEYAAKVGAQKGETYYYVDYPAANNKLSYVFYVVLNADGKLEENKKSATLDPFNDIAKVAFDKSKATATYSKFDNQTVANDAYLRITGLTDKQSAVVSYKKITKFANGYYTPASALLDTEFEALPAVGTYDIMDFIVSDVKEDEGVVFLYEIKEEGKKSFYEVAELAPLDTKDSTTFAFDYEDVRTKNTETPKYNFTFTVNKEEDVDEWTYTYAYAKLDKEGGLATVWSQDYPISLTWDKTAGIAGLFKYVAKDIILDATDPDLESVTKDPTTGADKINSYKSNYAIKLVKTSKVADFVKVDYKTIEVEKSVE